MNDEKPGSLYSIAFNIRSTSATIEQLTEVMGIAPTRSRTLGEPLFCHGRVRHRMEFNMWSYDTPLGETDESDPHLDALWGPLAPAIERLARSSLEYWCDLNVFQKLNRDEFQFHGAQIESRWLNLIGSAGGTITFDEYVQSFDDEELVANRTDGQ